MGRFSRNICTLALVLLLCLISIELPALAQVQRCVDNGDGTVTDHRWGLTWQKQTNGPMTWNEAITYADSLSLGGHSAWTLPDVDALKGLYDSGCDDLMDVAAGDQCYWTSTSSFDDADYAGCVNFYYGSVSYKEPKSNSYYVRAVRLAQ